MYDQIHLDIIEYLNIESRDKIIIPQENITFYNSTTKKIQISHIKRNNKLEIFLFIPKFEIYWTNFDRRVHLWNDNNRLIGGNILSKQINIWNKRKVSYNDIRFNQETKRDYVIYNYFIPNYNVESLSSKKFFNFIKAFNSNDSPFIFLGSQEILKIKGS